jgi:tetratricopeptide (TPR) repeat protein
MNKEQKITELKAIIEKDPSNIDAYLEMAIAYREMGEFTLALEKLQEAEKLAKNNPEENNWCISFIFFETGIILLDMEKNREGLNYLMEGLKIVREGKSRGLTELFLVSIGRALTQMGMSTDGISILEGFLERNPEIRISSIYYNLATAYFELGNYQEAIRYFKEALELAEECKDLSDIVLAKINLGNIYKFVGDHINAEKYLLEALKDAKNIEDNYKKAMGYESLGLLYIDKGDKKTAKKLLNRAYTFYKSVGKKEQAEETLRIIKEI